MNIFDFANAQITDNNPLFIGAKVFDFIQSDKKARVSDLVRTLLSVLGANSYDSNFAINLYGDISYSNNSIVASTDCAIFRNNEIFILSAVTINNIASLSGAYLNFLDGADGTSNPQYFKDGQTGNLARVRNCTITTSPVTTGTAYSSITFDTLKYLNNYSNTLSSASISTGISPIVGLQNLTSCIYANISLSVSTNFTFPSLPDYVKYYTIKVISINSGLNPITITVVNGDLSHTATISSVGKYCILSFIRIPGPNVSFSLQNLYTL